MSGGLTIIVSGPGRSTAKFTLKDRELTIGRAGSNDIVLPDIGVSRRHARLVPNDGAYLIIDIVSTNGTYLNGRRLMGPAGIGPSDLVNIGAFTLEIAGDGAVRSLDRQLQPFVARDATEAALLHAIGEGDEPSRQVYGDWLEEHGHMREAEFIRLQQTLVAMVPEAPGFESSSQRLRALAAALDFRWRVRVARPAIEQCEDAPAFDFRCPKDWGSLAPTGRDDIRHCSACKKQVYYCGSVPEARRVASSGACVALDVRAVRWKGDVKPPYDVAHCPSCRADVGRPPNLECPSCGASLYRGTTVVGMLA
ncbi:MAG TPA: FHA domain-containing protein [Kofleriaceae bacterium]|nr:FHA domain-containing protein [Kofleriaceae bacterium]